jgi:hypothetical protein
MEFTSYNKCKIVIAAFFNEKKIDEENKRTESLVGLVTAVAWFPDDQRITSGSTGSLLARGVVPFQPHQIMGI